VGLGGVALFTCLLIVDKVSEASYIGLMLPLALVCIVLLCLPRLRELDLKNLKIVLSEIKQVKAEIEEMYGGIENIKRSPLILDDARMKELGLKPGGIPQISAVMRYTVGCMKRERERLAQIFVRQKSPEQIAESILDGSLDDKVFKWAGPESNLSKSPKRVVDEPKGMEAEHRANTIENSAPFSTH
jgi:hypothetical protein